MALSSAATNIADPGKWLRILQRWHPRKPQEVLVAFINDLIEAAGPQRVERLDALFVRVDKTTRSAQEKLDKLRQWRDAMRADPWFWPQHVERDRPVAVLIKRVLDESPRPLTRREVEQKFRKFRKVPSTGLGQELKELANRGEIDRHKLGLYWRKGTAAAPYESDALRAYKLIHGATNHRMREAELALALGFSRQEAATLVSLMRKRGLFEPATGKGIVVASAESLSTLQRGPIFEGRGGIFFAPPQKPASVDPAAFTALRPERPRVDRVAQAKKIAWLNTLNGEQLRTAVAAIARELACDPEDLAERLSKSAQRELRRESARERWREQATNLMEQHPIRSPKPLRDLFRDSNIEGLTLRVFLDVIREVAAALLDEKGLKTSWSAAGAPPRR
jgi:hypothetical protein